MRTSALFYLTILCLNACSAVLCLAQEGVPWKVGGASLFVPVIERFADSYQEDRESRRPAVTGSTTGKGIDQLVNGEIALVAASRRMNSQEKEEAARKKLQIAEKQVGKAALAIVTNAKNPVNELTLEQVREIFVGQIVNWKAVGGPDAPIRVTVRPVPETGAGVLFQHVMLKGAAYAPKAQVMQSYRTTVSVASTSLAIGYIPTSSTYYHNMDTAGVKELKIRLDDRSPAMTAPVGLVNDTTFPVNIPLIFMWNKQSNDPCVPDFVDFVGKKLREENTHYRPNRSTPKKLIAASTLLKQI
jgi:phosphate transport system substrate-binding protein